jgi:hypothetical protein
VNGAAQDFGLVRKCFQNSPRTESHENVSKREINRQRLGLETA